VNPNRPRYTNGEWLARQIVVKPAADGEETRESSRWASRGERGQRVRKDESRNLGDPVRWWKFTNTWQENITDMWLHWESEGFIVAKKRLNTVERRNPTEDMFR